MKPENPPDRKAEFERLQETDSRVRRQFLETELQTCRTTLQVGEFELAAGNLSVAEKEVGVAEKAVRVVRRFLPKLAQDERQSLQAKLQEVLVTLDDLKSRLRLRRARSGPGA